MNAVWMRVRAEMRARARATIALALLAGLGGGIVIAAFAGARRTETAYGRFLDEHRGADLLAGSFVGGESFFDGRELPTEDFGRLDGVVGAEKVRFFLVRNPFGERDEDEGFMTVDARSPERAGPPIDTYKVLEGRLPDPRKPEEAVVTLLGAERAGMRVGTRFALEGVSEVFPDFAAAAERKPLEIRIVGRVAAPGDFPPQTGDETITLHMTPAFYERYPEMGFGFPGGVVLRLEDDAGAADRFRAAYERVGGNPAFTIERGLQDANVQRSIHLQVIALMLLAAFGAVTFVLVFGQTIARQIYLESGDAYVISALGMTRTQLTMASLVRALIAAASGAALAILIAFMLSPLMPQGTARSAEPAPGVSFDPVALGLGAAILVTSVAVLALWPAWRASGARIDVALAKDRPSAAAEFVARTGRVPALVAGVRFALQRGSGRTSMPVRSTIASLTLGIFVLAASVTFASSLDHFLETPRLYGSTWDARVGIERPESFTNNQQTVGVNYDVARIARTYDEQDPTVHGVSIGATTVNGFVGTTTIEILAMEPVSGQAPMPPLIEGRYPRSRPAGQAQEIVLGKRAFERARAKVGDTIGVAILDASDEPIRMKVVGVGVVPLFVDTSTLGETGLMTPNGVTRAVLPNKLDEFNIDNIFVASGGKPIDVERLARIAGGGARAGEHVHIWADAPPADVLNFGRVQKMPVALGLMLGLFAAATLIHTLISAVGRRRRDLGILKTIGFVRKQIRRAVRTHAMVLAVLAVIVGAPTGIAAGRWLWSLFAEEQGVTAEPVIHAVTIAGGVIATLLIAALIAAFPARAAARTQPAAVLRTE